MNNICGLALLVGISILASVIYAQIEMKRMSASNISNTSGADGRCDAPASAGTVNETQRDVARG